jgi:hypothetical protein
VVEDMGVRRKGSRADYGAGDALSRDGRLKKAA